MTAAASVGSDAEPVRGARALFRFHLSLFVWWTFVQVYYRTVARWVHAEPTFPFAVVSLAFIVTSLLLTRRFALGRRGTAAEGIARVALLFAALDLFCETLQFAPQLGLPALIPHDKNTLELLVRGLWGTAEFAMRSAVFLSLWRSQSGASKRWVVAFFGLVGAHWVVAMISFARVTDAYAAWWSTQRAVLAVLRFGPLLGLAWLSILVWLSQRVAGGRHAAAS